MYIQAKFHCKDIAPNGVGGRYIEDRIIWSNPHNKSLWGSYSHNPTQKQLNLTRLRLDIIINTNPPHPPTQPHHTQTIQDRGFSLVKSLYSYH